MINKLTEDRFVLLPGTRLGLSAQRLWEHTQYRQINPFEPITHTTSNESERFIEITYKNGLTGVTLHEAKKGPVGFLTKVDAELVQDFITLPDTKRWIDSIKQHLVDFVHQQAVRNLPKPFLPPDPTSPLGITGIHCALQDWLTKHQKDKAELHNWHSRIEKLSQKGLRFDEIDYSEVYKSHGLPDDGLITGGEIQKSLRYTEAMLSVLPVIKPLSKQLEFLRVKYDTPIKRLKPKLKKPMATQPMYYDPILGFWIDKVTLHDLLGDSEGWLVFTSRGKLITSEKHSSGWCDNKEDAMEMAALQARKMFPKLSSQGFWSKYRMNGGEHYREWLVTLPNYRFSYYTNHFQQRNILLHLRCDIRLGFNGERILVVQEIQSDWVQAIQKAKRFKGADVPPIPPWASEWQSLAFKLLLLHAVSLNIDAIGWTTGNTQVERYMGYGDDWLRKQYDEILPKEANKLMKKYKVEVVTMEVYVPVNFTVKPAEMGYWVLDENEQSLGIAQTEKQIISLLPNGAHEQLIKVHGIVLNENLRETLSAFGFFAWGMGVV